MTRPSGRAPDEMRAVTFTSRFAKHAEGSVLIEVGDTQVLCTASVEDYPLPAFLRGKDQGWVTAEYGMLPRSTHTRSAREAARGKPSGRTQEVQRLIGRSLRAVIDLEKADVGLAPSPSTATCCRPTAAHAPPRSPEATLRSHRPVGSSSRSARSPRSHCTDRSLPSPSASSAASPC